MSQDNRNELAGHLQRIEDMWQKLIYVKWSQESFALMALLAQQMEQVARSHGEEELTGLAAQLEQHLKTCVAAGHIPQEADRERLVALLNKLRRILSATDTGARFDTKPLISAATEVFVIDAGNIRQLLLKLKDTGFQVRHLDTIDKAEAAFAETSPVAVIMDVDFPNEPLAGIGMIAEIRALTNLAAPVFFIAERDDITARLEAVRAGGIGYFNKLVDITILLERLQYWLFQQSAQGQNRVLIVDDTPAEAQEMAGILESQGMLTRVVLRPMEVIQHIYGFQPDLLLLDLELKEVSGLELARVLSQHQACEVLPMILLSSPAYVTRHLSKLIVEGASLLSKPVASPYLSWAVAQQLRRAQALRLKLTALSDQDVVSGLYNRRHFLAQLERSIAALGVNARSVAVMLVMLDNLRAIRDSTNVLVADEVVEQAAGRVRKVLGRRYTAARFGDAIFAVVMSDIHKEALMAAARALRDALETGAYEMGEQTLLLRTSIGVSMTADEKEDFLTLIQQADVACSMAREAKGEHIYIHHDIYAQRDEEEFQRQRLLKKIEQALEQERMHLMFQPIVSLRGDRGERYEVLLRVSNNEDRELLPETVFGITQRHPLGIALDRWVVAHSIRQLKERQAKVPATTLFIKVLPATLQDNSLKDWLKDLLEKTRMNAGHLVFQVAETTAERDLRELFGFLQIIKRLGCGFCLDRFGHKANSLALLKNLGADYVKLDMYFVHGLVGDEAKQQQLKELVRGLEGLKVPAIVGGIEDMQTLPVLWSYGINYVQGFFLQPPHEEMSYDFASDAL